MDVEVSRNGRQDDAQVLPGVVGPPDARAGREELLCKGEYIGSCWIGRMLKMETALSAWSRTACHVP